MCRFSGETLLADTPGDGMAAHDDQTHGTRSARVGLVLAGAGARGAYEAGALSVLLPVLAAAGARPRIFVGTSAGAINATLFAGLAHLPVDEQARAALRTWREIDKSDVYDLVMQTVPSAAARYLAGLVRLPGPFSNLNVAGLLDTTPLHQTLRRRLDWAQLHRNLRPDRDNPAVVDALAVTTTACHSGRTEIFVEGPRAATLPASDDDRAVDYIREDITPAHVLASAAIPVVFPPVLVGTGKTRGWYLDGGVRLNAPIKPALALGAERLVVVATDPARRITPQRPVDPGPTPLIQDASAQVLHGALTDRMIEDLRTLGKIDELVHTTNQLRQLAARTGAQPADVAAPRSPDGREYTIVEYLFAGPEPGRAGALGALAEQVLARRCGGVRALRHLDLAALGHLLGSGPSRGELLSYVLFEPEFLDGAIELGRQDAQTVLGRTPDVSKIWHSSAL
jgi:NTE family protein